jgi:hypothetical protein
MSDYDVASYLVKICRVYGHHIQYQDSTRSLIDDMFGKIRIFYDIQSFFFLTFVFIPIGVQIFALRNPQYQFGSSILTLWALSMYFVLMLFQMKFQGLKYFTMTQNITDMTIVISYCVFFYLKFNDRRNYLPQLVLEDDDLEYFAQRPDLDQELNLEDGYFSNLQREDMEQR